MHKNVKNTNKINVFYLKQYERCILKVYNVMEVIFLRALLMYAFIILFQYFSYYGPDFTLDIDSGNRKDYNTYESLNNIINVIASNNIL